MTLSCVRPGQHNRRDLTVNLLMAVVVGATAVVAASSARAGKAPAVIQIYNGLGTPQKARLWGRVLEDKGQTRSNPSESRWRKLKRNIDALESDEIPGAKLEIRVAGRSFLVQADEEGLFELDIPGPLPAGDLAVEATLKDKRDFRVQQGKLLIWPTAPGVAVISDIDDTVLQTGVSSKLKLVKGVLLTSAHDLKTYRHAPSLYKVWGKRGYPIVFVSGSPVNLYTKLSRFLTLRGFPEAPLLLKDFGGQHGLTDQKAYKLHQIGQVLELLPGYKLLLVGDSGEQDPEIYAHLKMKYPKQVKLIMIHRVTEQRSSARRFKHQQVFSSYKELARELRRRGLITREELGGVEKGP